MVNNGRITLAYLNNEKHGVLAMKTYLGDLGILFSALLILIYIMWDKFFPKD